MHIPIEIKITHPFSSDGTMYIIYEVNLFHTNSSDDTIYAQRQKLSTTNFVVNIFRARLTDVNKPYR